MGTMRFLLLLSLISLAFCVQKCKDLKKAPIKCCIEPKKQDCWGVAKNTEAACICAPNSGGSEALSYVERCEWNLVFARFDGSTAIIPCQGFTENCPYYPTAESITCAPRIDGLIDYPPREHHFRGLAKSEAAYCKMEADGKMLTQEVFYKTFLTCWSFDCLPHLRKPAGVADKKGNDWCLPPLDTKNRLKFATNYCDPENVDTPAENCVLLPFCNSEVYEKNKTREIDPTKFMYPLKNDSQSEIDKERCQLLCPADTNDGLWGTEKCVIRPPCLKDHAPAVAANSNSTNAASETAVEPNKDSKDTSDPMEVGQEYCLPWCSYNIKFPSDEDYRKSGKRANNCINRPICTADGELPDREVNVHNSEYCVPIRKCKDNSETYFCEGMEESDEEPKPLSSGLGIGAISGIIVGCLVAVAAIGAFVYWFFFFRKRNNDDLVEDQENAPAKKNRLEGDEARKKKNMAEPKVIF